MVVVGDRACSFGCFHSCTRTCCHRQEERTQQQDFLLTRGVHIPEKITALAHRPHLFPLVHGPRKQPLKLLGATAIEDPWAFCKALRAPVEKCGFEAREFQGFGGRLKPELPNQTAQPVCPYLLQASVRKHSGRA